MDPVRILEAVYDLESEDEKVWLVRLARDVCRELSQSPSGFFAWTYCVDATGYIRLRSVAHEGVGEVGGEVLRLDLGVAEQALLAQFHLRGGIDHVSRSLHAAPGSVLASYCARSFELMGGSDMLAVTAVDPTRHGCIVGLLQERIAEINPMVRARWQRLGAHIAAAHRLRRKLAGAGAAARIDQAEAILEVNGEVSHAVGHAAPRQAREVLRDAVRVIDGARGAKRSAHEREVLEAWKGLVAGRWSLVDVFDSDGRRYMVAHRNDPELADPRALTERERQIAGYADLGRSNKEIAYELGLSETTVAVHLKRARSKLAKLRS